MAENYEKAEADYLAGMKYKEIAVKYGVSLNTVKSCAEGKKGAYKEKGAHTKEKGCTRTAG